VSSGRWRNGTKTDVCLFASQSDISRKYSSSPRQTTWVCFSSNGYNFCCTVHDHCFLAHSSTSGRYLSYGAITLLGSTIPYFVERINHWSAYASADSLASLKRLEMYRSFAGASCCFFSLLQATMYIDFIKIGS
jgi:hypothetical protein